MKAIIKLIRFRVICFMNFREAKRLSLLGAFAESTNEGIVFAHVKTSTIIYGNQTFLGWLGYTNKEISSKPFFEFLHPEDKAKTKDKAANMAVKDDLAVNFENRYISKQGETVHLKWRGFVYFGYYVCAVNLENG